MRKGKGRFLTSVITKIGEVLGLDVDEESGSLQLERLRRIADRLTTKVGDAEFENEVFAIDEEIGKQGSRALFGTFMQVTAPEPERVYKIKRSQKGQRIKIKSASGKNFAFGPVWCEAVRACKALALNENNREKLNMHGTHLGVEYPDQLSSRELCAAIASRMEEAEAV
jgi:hypothetical protein